MAAVTTGAAVFSRDGGGGAGTSVATVAAAGGRGAVRPGRTVQGRVRANTAGPTLAANAHFTAVAAVTAGTLVDGQGHITGGTGSAITGLAAVTALAAVAAHTAIGTGRTQGGGVESVCCKAVPVAPVEPA
ncbi:Uncharacterised protein [Mycobacterium tuberculosis]|nr:Uncharacterised protein [Mycobacterium tuberculosis]